MTSRQWVEYDEGTKRVQKQAIPTSSITAETVTVDGFVLSQTDNIGITTRQARQYTASGMKLTQTDGRGNSRTTTADLAGRPLELQFARLG